MNEIEMCECGTPKEACDRLRYNFGHWRIIAEREKTKVERLRNRIRATITGARHPVQPLELDEVLERLDCLLKETE